MELDYKQIGQRIARRRKELGLKQVEVCDIAGINDKYLSCITFTGGLDEAGLGFRYNSGRVPHRLCPLP